MRHVLVETNWVVDWAAPVHHRKPTAVTLLERARDGEFRLHVPAVCLLEARKVIRRKYHPKNEAGAIGAFAAALWREGVLQPDELMATLRVCDIFESRIVRELADLETTLESLQQRANVDVFPLSEAMLRQSLRLATAGGVELNPFDNAILGAVLERARDLNDAGSAEVAFAVLDADLRPWNRDGSRKKELAELYDSARIRVYGDFELGGSSPSSRSGGVAQGSG